MSRSESVFRPEALEEVHEGGPDPARRQTAGPGPTDELPEIELEGELRPGRFEEFVGQRRVVDNLSVALLAARSRGDPPDHILLSGPPGLGKTSLSRIIANEVSGALHSTSGPALERARDLVGILTQLKKGDVLFIDEIHRVPAPVEEFLYSAMEDFRVDLTLDQGPHARVLPLQLHRFTLIGATTREGLLSAPFRARFGHFERLEPYPTEDLVAILMRSAGLLALRLEHPAAVAIASRSRGTPRVANRFLRRARDLAQVRGSETVDEALAKGALERLGVDERGLEPMDRRILHCLAAGGGRPLGLKTLAAAVDEAEDTIEDVYEPHLLRCGLIQRTSRGRIVTGEGCRAIGVDPQAAPTEPGLFE